VNDDPAAEAPPELGREEQADVTRRGAAKEPSGDDDRESRHAEPLELVRGRGDRKVTRAECRRGDRKRRLLDHERCRSTAGDKAVDRLACERERERVAYRLWHVVQDVALRRRPKDDIVRAGLGDDDSRVGEQGYARHVLRCAAAAVTTSATQMPTERKRRAALRDRCGETRCAGWRATRQAVGRERDAANGPSNATRGIDERSTNAAEREEEERRLRVEDVDDHPLPVQPAGGTAVPDLLRLVPSRNAADADDDQVHRRRASRP
jgi:hypothetical protein